MLTSNSTQVNRKFSLVHNTPLYALNPHSLPVRVNSPHNTKTTMSVVKAIGNDKYSEELIRRKSNSVMLVFLL